MGCPVACSMLKTFPGSNIAYFYWKQWIIIFDLDICGCLFRSVSSQIATLRPENELTGTDISQIKNKTIWTEYDWKCQPQPLWATFSFKEQSFIFIQIDWSLFLGVHYTNGQLWIKYIASNGSSDNIWPHRPESSSIEFSRGCKSVDGISMVTELR